MPLSSRLPAKSVASAVVLSSIQLVNTYMIYVVVETLCYKPEGGGFKTRCGECISSIYLILPAALGSGVYSASNINIRSRKIIFLGSRVRRVRKADKLTAICEPIF
jgi:hypothetical protein